VTYGDGVTDANLRGIAEVFGCGSRDTRGVQTLP
jgi:hypothetical protein